MNLSLGQLTLCLALAALAASLFLGFLGPPPPPSFLSPPACDAVPSATSPASFAASRPGLSSSRHLPVQVLQFDHRSHAVTACGPRCATNPLADTVIDMGTPAVLLGTGFAKDSLRGIKLASGETGGGT